MSDINDFEEISDSLRETIKKSLSQDESIDQIKPLLNIPILLLYECDETKNNDLFSDEYKQSILEYHKDRATEYFRKQLKNCSDIHLYEKITFHIILFPVADKNIIVNKFIELAKVYRN